MPSGPLTPTIRLNLRYIARVSFLINYSEVRKDTRVESEHPNFALILTMLIMTMMMVVVMMIQMLTRSMLRDGKVSMDLVRKIYNQ